MAPASRTARSPASGPTAWASRAAGTPARSDSAPRNTGEQGRVRLATWPSVTQPTPWAASPSRCQSDSPWAASATGSTDRYSVPNRWRRSTRVVEVQSGVMRVEPRRRARAPSETAEIMRRWPSSASSR